MPGLRIARVGLATLAGQRMTWTVKEAYYTLQGEGAQTGRAAVFLRFAGCNLWSGLERDRAVLRLDDGELHSFEDTARDLSHHSGIIDDKTCLHVLASL